MGPIHHYLFIDYSCFICEKITVKVYINVTIEFSPIETPNSVKTMARESR